MEKVSIPSNNFEALANDRVSWRRSIRKGVADFEEKRIAHHQLKRAARNGTLVNYDDDPNLHKCPDCDRICLSKAGLK